MAEAGLEFVDDVLCQNHNLEDVTQHPKQHLVYVSVNKPEYHGDQSSCALGIEYEIEKVLFLLIGESVAVLTFLQQKAKVPVNAPNQCTPCLGLTPSTLDNAGDWRIWKIAQ